MKIKLTQTAGREKGGKGKIALSIHIQSFQKGGKFKLITEHYSFNKPVVALNWRKLYIIPLFVRDLLTR